MTSESGAEYSFHEAFHKSAGNIVAAEAALKKPKILKETMEHVETSVFKAELIYPVSERQLSRAMPSPGVSLVTETP
jgi:hypothetical protein